MLFPIQNILAEENLHEISANLNKKFVEKDERIEVSGNVKNFNPDFKNLIRILETKEGHRVDYDTAQVDKDDGSFEFYWQVDAIYDSTWVPNSEYVIKMNYAGIDNWKELEFTYCDKRQQKSSDYLKLCQEAYGFVKSPNDSSVVKSIESLDSKIESEPRTKFENGMEFVQKCSLKDLAEGKSGTQCDWVESDRNYFNRIMIPLISNIVIFVIIIVIIIGVIFSIKNRSKRKNVDRKRKHEKNEKREDEIKKLKERVEELEKDRNKED